MALTIMTNTAAIGAASSVSNANSKLSKTIQQLSTGLRINSAADDASGLAVSEKLRTQISGLSKATSNAQDAISMLQTAEGAMGSMTSIIQRMRELAVQAGDPAYTTNDRAMLQLEVDQLKTEITRISSSTEFNTKKLLNGDSTAIWSSSSPDLQAIIRSDVAQGNYKIDTFISGGQNEIYKTDIMTLKAGAQSVSLVTEGRDVGIAAINNVKGMLTSSDVSGTATVPRMGLRIQSGTALMTAAMQNVGFVSANTAVTTVAGSLGGSFTVAGLSAMNSGYFEFKAITDRAASGTGQVQIRYTDATTGVSTDWATAAIGTAGTTVGNFSLGGTTIAAGTAFQGAANGFKAGDISLFAYTKAVTAAGTVTDAYVTVATGKSSASGTYATTGYTVLVKDAVSPDAKTTNTFYTAQIDKKLGTISYGQFDVTLDKNSEVQDTGAISATGATGISLNIVGEGGLASKWTQLSDIKVFTNSDGRNLIAYNQKLTILGNNKTAVVNIEGSDTISGLEEKLTNAIVEQLGMGYNTATNEQLVNYINPGTATANTNEAVAGTFVIQSARLGADSQLSFIGDQGLINALGVNTIQKGIDGQVTMNVYDAHTGNLIGGDTVGDNILRDVIKGVDVKVQPVNTDTMSVAWNATTKSLDFSQNANGSTSYLHVTNNAMIAGIGANQGQTIDLSIAEMSLNALEITNVDVSTFDKAQSSITQLDRALETLTQSRSVIGAQINRLDYTISNLNTARENMTASDSRIRDLDIATASSDLVARQVMLQSATAMLAQANQLPSYAAQLLR